MSLAQFDCAAQALKDFPTKSPPTVQRVSNKVVGIIGGEPLLHPMFSEICRVMAVAIPNRRHRGLWTGLSWQKTKYAKLIRETFGFVNNNKHDGRVKHTPVLVAIKDIVHNEVSRKQLIRNCWLQTRWSGTITPKGLFFCEVAGAWDMLLGGPGGLPVGPDCWRRPLSDYQDQINRWCPRCGVPLSLEGRIDSEEIDDISVTNLDSLQDSPRVKAGRYEVYDKLPRTNQPWKYLQ